MAGHDLLKVLSGQREDVTVGLGPHGHFTGLVKKQVLLTTMVAFSEDGYSGALSVVLINHLHLRGGGKRSREVYMNGLSFSLSLSLQSHGR